MSDHPRSWHPYEPDRDPTREADAVELGERVGVAYEFAAAGYGFRVSLDHCSVSQFRTGVEYARAEYDATVACLLAGGVDA